mgnify:CR=1 FL=1
MRSLTITMSGTPPVRVDRDAWPIVAYAGLTDTNLRLVVRRHADGRAIVHGTGPGERRGGRVTVDDRLSIVIRELAEELELGEAFAQRCIADLPPTVLR